MNPGLLGLVAAACWGVHDVIGARVSAEIGAVKTATAVTLVGLALLTLGLAIAGGFPTGGVERAWLPALSGVFLALATIWLFAALVIAGVVLVALGETSGGERTGNRRRAIVFAILSHATFALGNFIGQYAATIYGAIPATWISRIGGSAAIIPLLLLTSSKPGEMPRGLLPFLVLMGGLDVFALSMLNLGGHTSQPELAIVTASAAGVIAILLAWVFFKERIAPLRWIGIIMTFGGVAALTAHQ